MTRKIPTPTATARISVMFGTEGTCVASTCKSGSEMVITTPNRKDNTTISRIFLLWVILAPTFSPMGVMDISAPRVKNIIPAMTITAPTRKHSRILEVMGAMVKLNTITIPTTGRTAFKDSANFCRIFGFNNFNIGLSFL